MRLFLAFAIVLLLASCSPVSCPVDERDGGIGGTGGCSNAQPKEQLVQLFSPRGARLG